MKNLILLITVLTITYACNKPQPIEPFNGPTNKINNQQSQCGFNGIYVADSIATVNYAVKWSTTDTIVQLSSEIIYIGDTTFNTGVTCCKYELDSVTRNLNYLSYGTKHNYNGAYPLNYKYDTIAFLTNTNKTIILVKQ